MKVVLLSLLLDLVYLRIVLRSQRSDLIQFFVIHDRIHMNLVLSRRLLNAASHLLDIDPDLFGQEISQLLSNLVLDGKLLG